MPAPITHIVIAQKLLPYFSNIKDPKAFILGNCFPDIRCITNLTREQTHFPIQGYKEILHEKDSFLCGWKTHVYIDILKSKYYNYTNEFVLYNERDVKLINKALKFLEDRELYKKMSYVDIDYLKHYNYEYNLSTKSIAKWNFAIKEYIKAKTNKKSISQYFFNLDCNKTFIDDFFCVYDKVKHTKNYKEISSKFYENIEKIFFSKK